MTYQEALALAGGIASRVMGPFQTPQECANECEGPTTTPPGTTANPSTTAAITSTVSGAGNCCGYNLPATLSVLVSAGACRTTSGTLTWNSGTGRWQGSIPMLAHPGQPAGTLTLALYCGGSQNSAGDFRLDITCSLTGTTSVGVVPTSSTCGPPLTVTFSNASIGTCCDGTPGVTGITITGT